MLQGGYRVLLSSVAFVFRPSGISSEFLLRTLRPVSPSYRVCKGITKVSFRRNLASARSNLLWHKCMIIVRI